MSKPKNAAHHKHQHSRHGEERPKPATPPMSDRAVYMGTVMIGIFVVLLGWLLSEGAYWRQVLLAYVALALLNINFAGWDICRGKTLSDWKQSLAKIPLRSAGYGTKDGKPVENAHDQPAAKKAMIIFGFLSVLVVATVGFALLKLI